MTFFLSYEITALQLQLFSRNSYKSRQRAISKAPCEELETIPYLTVSKKVLLQINSDMLQGLPLALVASYRKSKFDRELRSDHLNRKREIFWRKLHPWDEDCFT